MRDNNLYGKRRNRYLIGDKPMTLIIGIKCKDGVVLVSDTKITDTESTSPSYDSKILTPLENTPFIVGAAGYSDLFKEFNRKIPLVVNQRLNEFRIKNINALLESGLNREQAILCLQRTGKKIEIAQQPIELSEDVALPETESHITPIPIPYVYTPEHFMDDCRKLIETVSSQSVEEGAYPLDILIGVHKTPTSPTLHYVDCRGHEHEVETYHAIGSGSPHVRQFFDVLYDYSKGMTELITFAYLVITYVQHIAKDPYVGYSDTNPPEAVAVFNDGRYGRIPFWNEEVVLNALKARMVRFEELIKDTKTEFLKTETGIIP
jgi:20S proteasome alpha/beta subunit